MPRHAIKIPIRRQHRQIMAQAKLCQQGIDRTDLQPGSPAAVAQTGGVDVVLSVGDKKRQGGEVLEDLRARLGPGESLQQFLQH